jgi:hypothetical protein
VVAAGSSLREDGIAKLRIQEKERFKEFQRVMEPFKLLASSPSLHASDVEEGTTIKKVGGKVQCFEIDLLHGLTMRATGGLSSSSIGT